MSAILAASDAQRRPGHAPRRHHVLAAGLIDHDPAQRRPGHAPRRHDGRLDTHAAGDDRSTKAGARTPATRTSTGPRTTAPSSLNEGRGTHPGDTHAAQLRRRKRPARSTKAGARTPATPGWATDPGGHRVSLNEGRGTHPGDTLHLLQSIDRVSRAQRRPGHAPRRHEHGRRQPLPERDRSTKAGARTPATRSRGWRVPSEPWTLNEGRGTHPGDTCSCAPARGTPTALNEGRGTHPGDTLYARCQRWSSVFAQRRPGHAPRRHTPRGIRC